MGRHEGVPIRADMATIIQSPMGIAESALMTKSAPPVSSAQHARRTQLKDQLISKLKKEHGAGPIQEAVIVREVERWSKDLATGKLTAAGLATLERQVADAVRATKPGPMQTFKPPPTYVRTGGEMAEAVAKVANWTDVARHRGSFYAIEETAKAAAHEARKVELRQTFKHQMALEAHKKRAQEQLLAEEASEVAKNLADYHADMLKADERAKAKTELQRKQREVQMKEQAARMAAAERLRKLEDDELDEHLRKEAEVARQRAEQKRRADEEYHRQTALANKANRERREAAKQAEWAEEQRLNATWKAMLDKQEADRNDQYARLRERIHKMQRAYEDNAGAEDERRLREEEDLRNRYIAQEEARLTELDRTKRAARKAAVDATTEYLMQQKAEKEAKYQAEKAAERAYADSVRAEVRVEEEKEAQRKALRKAAAESQRHYLNEQIAEQRDQAARDPGASEMTPLEATINRPLLVSIVQHKHPRPSPFN